MIGIDPIFPSRFARILNAFANNTIAGYDPGLSASGNILLQGIRRFTDPIIKQKSLTARLLRSVLRLNLPRDRPFGMASFFDLSSPAVSGVPLHCLIGQNLNW
jgi:hypothetical protein